ncbi:hypothetical protein MNV49_004702 [Pseudohyphozyma bogoriensis]|nr:hypothetical protein MNV49_004702 [Pseudohyphozyma bogoriensis]
MPTIATPSPLRPAHVSANITSPVPFPRASLVLPTSYSQDRPWSPRAPPPFPIPFTPPFDTDPPAEVQRLPLNIQPFRLNVDSTVRLVKKRLGIQSDSTTSLPTIPSRSSYASSRSIASTPPVPSLPERYRYSSPPVATFGSPLRRSTNASDPFEGTSTTKRRHTFDFLSRGVVRSPKPSPSPTPPTPSPDPQLAPNLLHGDTAQLQREQRRKYGVLVAEALGVELESVSEDAASESMYGSQSEGVSQEDEIGGLRARDGEIGGIDGTDDGGGSLIVLVDDVASRVSLVAIDGSWDRGGQEVNGRNLAEGLDRGEEEDVAASVVSNASRNSLGMSDSLASVRSLVSRNREYRRSTGSPSFLNFSEVDQYPSTTSLPYSANTNASFLTAMSLPRTPPPHSAPSTTSHFVTPYTSPQPSPTKPPPTGMHSHSVFGAIPSLPPPPPPKPRAVASYASLSSLNTFSTSSPRSNFASHFPLPPTAIPTRTPRASLDSLAHLSSRSDARVLAFVEESPKKGKRREVSESDEEIFGAGGGVGVGGLPTPPETPSTGGFAREEGEEEETSATGFVLTPPTPSTSSDVEREGFEVGTSKNHQALSERYSLRFGEDDGRGLGRKGSGSTVGSGMSGASQEDEGGLRSRRERLLMRIRSSI